MGQDEYRVLPLDSPDVWPGIVSWKVWKKVTKCGYTPTFLLNPLEAAGER